MVLTFYNLDMEKFTKVIPKITDDGFTITDISFEAGTVNFAIPIQAKRVNLDFIKDGVVIEIYRYKDWIPDVRFSLSRNTYRMITLQ